LPWGWGASPHHRLGAPNLVEENGIVYVKVYIQKRCQEEYVVYSGKGDTRELH
ncbi:hypothetical protein L916_01178, partial [Phytophthora nicotianae]